MRKININELELVSGGNSDTGSDTDCTYADVTYKDGDTITLSDGTTQTCQAGTWQ
ncbi:hypothetical protein ACSLBF_17060 [Pseudoalteromonas sp. T1lg65]|uniref:hypothetical protein n=1 Tax=Pseudoalteromonas sp. T1lg65 TaxID=2077101 RepID=UPI003F7A17DE